MENIQDVVKNGAFLVDVRTPSEFEDGHAKGTINIPLDEIEANLDRFKDKENIVVFCRSGGRSAHAKMILEQNGFKNVYNAGTWQNVQLLLLN